MASLGKSPDGKEEKITHQIIYVGRDTGYFEDIRDKYKELSPSVEVVFEQINQSESKKIQSLILKIRTVKPKLIIVDLSEHSEAMLHITRVWMRHNFHTEINFMGLCEYSQGRSMVVKAIMTTMACVHVKSNELESICYDINILAFPDKVENHGFATSQLHDSIKAYYPAKISMINENFLKMESNFSMNPKQQMRIHNYWFRSSVMGSNLMVCSDQSTENLYYNYKYGQLLQMVHKDPVHQTDNMEQTAFDELKEERAELVKESKRKLIKWIIRHQKHSKPKFLKALVVDKEGLFYDDQPLTDSYAFVFRNQPYLLDAKKELLDIKPQIIIFNLEHVSKAELEMSADIAHTFNNGTRLQVLIKAIKANIEGSKPIIIVFNTQDKNTELLQKTFDYQSILAVEEPMNIKLVLRMCEMLRGKIAPTLPRPAENDLYIDKNSEVSYCEIESEITLRGCSETDLYFDSDQVFTTGTVLRVSLPVPMYITVVNAPEYTTITSGYYAIIHGIGESERMKLRKFINSVFFRAHELKKLEAAHERDLVKKKYVDEKLKEESDAIKAEAEARAAKDKEQKELDDKANAVLEKLEEKP
jgi:hypothetical protein